VTDIRINEFPLCTLYEIYTPLCDFLTIDMSYKIIYLNITKTHTLRN